MHNDELHSLCRSSNIGKAIKSRIRWTGQIARMEERRGAFNISRSKPTENRPLGEPRHWREDNIRRDLKEIGLKMRSWIDSA